MPKCVTCRKTYQEEPYCPECRKADWQLVDDAAYRMDAFRHHYERARLALNVPDDELVRLLCAHIWKKAREIM